ncbi:hypothetical protein HUJ04_001816 [Dendroctonus ponderosae]|nr:hypothetical protein HUJ04_001816 [Dendroctonus ponderosae]
MGNDKKLRTVGNRTNIRNFVHIGDVMDIIALTNSGINFILYCTMSRQFRITFKEIFLLPIMNQFAPSSQYANIDKTGEKTQISANASFLRTCEQEDIRI